MRKMVAIFFLSVYLTAFTPFKEVWKLPVLIEHFMEHRAQDPSISILAFLDMHYMHGSPHDADYDRDMQLPFKMVSHTSLITFAIPSSPIHFQTAPPLYCKKEKPLLYNSTAYSFNFHNSIWQPPRAC
jgi:hypothetical protein